MGRNESGNPTATTGVGRFEVAFEQLEQSIERSAKKTEASLVRMTGTFEANLGRLETKLDITGETLDALADQFKETGNFLGRFVEEIGKWLKSDTIEKAGKAISLVPGNAADEKAVSELFSRTPDQLQKRFESREGRVAALESGGDAVVAKDTIAKIRHEQELILAALTRQGVVFRSTINDAAGRASNPGMPKTGQGVENAKQRLEDIRSVLREIRELATSPELREFIDKILLIIDRTPPKVGALGAQPGALQLANAGGEFTDATGEPLLRLGEDAEKAAQNFLALNQEVGRFGTSGGLLDETLVTTNNLFGEQSGLFGMLLKQVPELDGVMTEFFGDLTAGAENLDRTVEAVGDRFLDAFEGAILRGESLGDTLKSLGRDLANLALQEVKSGLLGGGSSGGGGSIFGTLFSSAVGAFTGGGLGAGISPTGSDIFGTPFAKGGIFEGGRITALAKGGALLNSIVDRPTLFPMADGMGLMGEAGPEAVLPLTRLANGELGVKGLGAGAAPAGPTNTYYIDARGADRQGFQELMGLIRRVDNKVNVLDRTLDRRAVNAVAWRRSRGPF